MSLFSWFRFVGLFPKGLPAWRQFCTSPGYIAFPQCLMRSTLLEPAGKAKAFAERSQWLSLEFWFWFAPPFTSPMPYWKHTKDMPQRLESCYGVDCYRFLWLWPSGDIPKWCSNLQSIKPFDFYAVSHHLILMYAFLCDWGSPPSLIIFFPVFVEGEHKRNPTWRLANKEILILGDIIFDQEISVCHVTPSILILSWHPLHSYSW